MTFTLLKYCQILLMAHLKFIYNGRTIYSNFIITRLSKLLTEIAIKANNNKVLNDST